MGKWTVLLALPVPVPDCRRSRRGGNVLYLEFGGCGGMDTFPPIFIYAWKECRL